MKEKLWLPVITCLAYCIGKELYKAIDYFREQVGSLVEHQENRGNRIRLTNKHRMRVAAERSGDFDTCKSCHYYGEWAFLKPVRSGRASMSDVTRILNAIERGKQFHGVPILS